MFHGKERNPIHTLMETVRQTQERGGHVVATAYDMSSRTDLVETSEPWVRYLFTDRMHTARIVS